MYQQYSSTPCFKNQAEENSGKETGEMSLTQKRWIILLIIAIAAFALGRLAVRAVMNLMLGGTMFGGNFL